MNYISINSFKMVGFNGVTPTFPTHKHMGVRKGAGIWNFSKNAVFLISSIKNQISPLLTSPRKTSKCTSVPPWKNAFRRHAHKHVKWYHFCVKLCCITPSGNTVQQHQCGKQSIARWQTGHGVFCQTITKSCEIHCQITNNMLEIISTKFCENSATFFH